MLLDLSPSLNLQHVCLVEPLVFWPVTRGERAGSPSGTGDQGPGREAASAGGEDGD